MPDIVHVHRWPGVRCSTPRVSGSERSRTSSRGSTPATGDAPVIGLTARIGGRELFVPIDRVEQLGPVLGQTSTTKLDLAQFERRPGEVLLRADVLDRSLINVNTARLVKAREVELVRDDGTWRVAGIDPSLRPRLWRLLPRRFRGHDTEHRQFVDWRDIEPFVGHVPTSRLKLAARRHRPDAPGADRRPGRGRLARGGRGDPRGGRPGQGARGRRVRGARRRAPGRVPARALRRGGRGGAGADGQRRRGRSAAGARPGASPADPERDAGCSAAQGARAARPQPADRRRDDEPGLHLGAAGRDRGGCARAGPGQRLSDCSRSRSCAWSTTPGS